MPTRRPKCGHARPNTECARTRSDRQAPEQPHFAEGGAPAGDRAAVAYAAALADKRFRSPVVADVAAAAAAHLTPDELAGVDAVARMMAVANLSANTAEGLFGRLSFLRRGL